MGTVQKVFWWIFWYAIVWFAFVCLIGGISEMNVPMPLQAILIFATFIFPGWYATRKVKQKALKKEMEQRTQNFTPQPQVVPTPPPTVSTATPSSQISSQTDNFEAGRHQPSQNAVPTVEEGLPNINTAAVEDLMQLSVVNRILAMQIISQKEKGGDYMSFEDLFARVQLSPQAKEELRRHFTVVSAGAGRLIDF